MPSSSPVLSQHPLLHTLQLCKTFEALKQVHARLIATGLILHTYPLSRFLFLSSALAPTLSYALAIFNRVPNPSIFLFNTLISSFSNKGLSATALSLYARVLTHPTLIPNAYTYPSLFKACGSHQGRALHAHVLKFLEPPLDAFVQASLVNFYSKCGQVGVSRYLFDQISKPDLATWNSMLSAYLRNAGCNPDSNVNDFSDDGTSLCVEVLCLFNRMQLSSVKPNEVTLVALISACADLGALGQGTWAHAYVTRENLEINHFVASALITMYGNCGRLDLACQLFDGLPERDTFCYNSMIRGLAVHGHGHKALHLFEKMKLEGLVPDHVTMLVVICACSHVGLVDQGCQYFESMERDLWIQPRLEHYCCLIDLLGRSGRIKEAEERVQNMPMKPNAVLWRSLLGAARVHGNLDVGEVALRHLIQLEPETSGNYVLLSNIYASMNRWDDVKRVRKLMKVQGIEKMPGSSIVEIDGSMHEFLIGDNGMHPQVKEIHMKLEEMGKRLQEHGHRPTTRDVFFDIEEEEKEDALSYHSERVAIAFALIASNSDSPIRIIKNLRVCSDCHATTKLISEIYEREIIVRDRTRFHHFKGGTCSCLDYW